MRYILLSLLLCRFIYAIDFETFKKEALSHSKILQAQKVESDIQMQQTRMELRSDNPELNIEGVRYNPNEGKDRWGYALDINQRIRTGSYLKGIRQKAEANELLQTAFLTQGKAAFLKELEALYTRYVFSVEMERVLQKEYQLLQQVARMVKSRYKSDSDTKLSWLQSKSEADALKSEVIGAKIERKMLYREMMAFAGIREDVTLRAHFLYSPKEYKIVAKKPAPSLKIAKAKERLYAAKQTIYSGSFRHLDIVGGVEKEPDQTIGRVGVALPITLFNNQKEERSLAKLKMKQAKLQKEQIIIQIEQKKRMLSEAISMLCGKYHTLQKFYKEQKELMRLLKDGYKIAKRSLFELLRAKSSFIATQKKLLQTQKEINLQTIELNYLEGKYNE